MLLRKCIMHPKSSHTIFECNSLRKALGAPLVKETLPKIKSTAVSISLPMNKFIMQTIAHVYEQGVGLKSQSPSLYNYCNFDKFSIKVDYLIDWLLCSHLSTYTPLLILLWKLWLNMEQQLSNPLWFTSSILLTFSSWVIRRGSS